MYEIPDQTGKLIVVTGANSGTARRPPGDSRLREHAS